MALCPGGSRTLTHSLSRSSSSVENQVFHVQSHTYRRLTFDEKDDRMHLQSSTPPGIDRRFRTEKGAANWWESNVDPETGKIRR